MPKELLQSTIDRGKIIRGRSVWLDNIKKLARLSVDDLLLSESSYCHVQGIDGGDDNDDDEEEDDDDDVTMTMIMMIMMMMMRRRRRTMMTMT